MQICNRRNEDSKTKVIDKRKKEQEYYNKRIEAHKIIRNKKKTYMKYVIESIEDQKHNNTWNMYQTVN